MWRFPQQIDKSIPPRQHMPFCACRCLCFRCATGVQDFPEGAAAMPRAVRRATHAGSWYEDDGARSPLVLWPETDWLRSRWLL